MRAVLSLTREDFPPNIADLSLAQMTLFAVGRLGDRGGRRHRHPAHRQRTDCRRRARGPCGLATPGTSKITGSEVWDNSQERWRLIDAQLDAVWQNRLQLDDGVLDIGRHRFLVVAMHGRTVVPVKSTRNYSASRSPSTTL